MSGTFTIVLKLCSLKSIFDECCWIHRLLTMLNECVMCVLAELEQKLSDSSQECLRIKVCKYIFS